MQGQVNMKLHAMFKEKQSSLKKAIILNQGYCFQKEQKWKTALD